MNEYKSILITLFLIVSTAMFAQQHQVTGIVVDNYGDPLVGVGISAQGARNLLATTDLNGKYTVSVPEGVKVLSFSYIGFTTLDIEIKGQTEINVTMIQNVSQLDEVTVTALGISREKKALGYSVAEVKGDDMTRVTQENVLNALSGKMAGVQIQNTGGDPGSSSSIIIRGATSLAGDNQPLFVIDGVPVNSGLNNLSKLGNNQVDYGNAINDLNPGDIESVSILKGPSAAALYGSRAGNGVVLITTKSGAKRSGIGVTLSSSVVFDKASTFFKGQSRFTTGQLVYSETADYWFGPELDQGNEGKQWALDGQVAPLVSYPNKWKDFFNEPGYTIDNNIGVTGNYDKGSFRISYGNMNNSGIVLNTDLTRNTFNVAPVYKILPNLVVSANVNISQSKSDNRPSTGGDSGNQTTLLALAAVPPHMDVNTLKDYWQLEGEQQRVYSAKTNNPYFLAYEMTNGFVRNRTFGNVKLDWEIIKNLSLMGRFSMDSYTQTKESKTPYSYSSLPKGAYGIEDDSHTELNSDFLLSYVLPEFSDFRINTSFGGNLMYANGNYLINTAKQLAIPDIYSITNADGAVYNRSGLSRKAIYSLYGMATISYKNWAYLDLTARNDWSSTLPPDNRSYFYPSASLSLLVNELIGISTSKNMIKLRAGWAQVGSDTAPYQLYPSYDIINSWGSVKRANYPSVLKSPNLKPEIATSQEYGIDVSAFQNRISLGVTYYKSDNRNQILNISDLAPSSGYSSQKINAGNVQSSGWEVELKTVPFEAKDFRWTLDFALTRNRTKVKELTDGMDFITLYDTDAAFARTKVGEYIGDIWGYSYKKVEDENSPYYGWPLLEKATGGYQLQALKEDKDMMKIGNFNHDFLLGISTGFTWKSFTLNAQIDWRQGGDFFSATQRRTDNAGYSGTFQGVSYKDANNLPAEIKANSGRYFGKWVGGFAQSLGGFSYPPGSENAMYNSVRPFTGAFVPGVYVDENGNYVENIGDPSTTSYLPAPYTIGNMWNFAGEYIHDASFVKLREISLSYTFPKEWITKLKMQRLGLTVFCRNIMLWTANNVNLDPEMAFNVNNGALQQGLEKFNLMPQTISYGAKLNIEF